MTKQGCAFPTAGAARGITMAMGGGVVSRHVGGSPGKAGPEGSGAGRVCRAAARPVGGGVTETDERRVAGAGSAGAGERRDSGVGSAGVDERRDAGAGSAGADIRRDAGADGSAGSAVSAGSAAITGLRRCVLMNVVVGFLCGGGGVLMMAWASATADGCGRTVRRAMRCRPSRVNRNWITAPLRWMSSPEG